MVGTHAFALRATARLAHPTDSSLVYQLHVAELGIDRHVGGVRAVSIRVLGVEEGAFGRNAGARQARQIERRAVRPDRGPAVDDLDLPGLAVEPHGGDSSNFRAQVLR